MARFKPFSEIVSEWSAEDRAAKAAELVRKLTDSVQIPINIHAANEIIQYTDSLSKQIPRSYAANAFKTFQDSQFFYEIISLLSLWDRADTNAVSIPTVMVLIDNDEVLNLLAKQTFDAHADRAARARDRVQSKGDQDFFEDMLQTSENEFALKQSDQALKKLRSSLERAKSTVSESKMKAVRNLRDIVSHSLTETRAAKKSPIRPMRYGEERELLEITIELIECLYCWVNGTGFDISGEVFEGARRNARELWDNCEFNIPKKREFTEN